MDFLAVFGCFGFFVSRFDRLCSFAILSSLDDGHFPMTRVVRLMERASILLTVSRDVRRTSPFQQSGEIPMM